jgi:aspartyl aminopeptidase
VTLGYDRPPSDALPRAVARSLFVSADMAHAVHPNYPDKHDKQHRPVLGGGPVIKVNASQSYATDAVAQGAFAEACRAEGVSPQFFVSRNDQACGSTIGPITAARVGIRTIDVGNPMLAMHSCRETAGSADGAVLTRVFSRLLREPPLGDISV